MAEKSYIDMKNARTDEQRAVMSDIEHNNECPFCPDNLAKYHKEPILRKTAQWVLTRNQWPYDHTDYHFLAIARYHAESITDLREGAFDELQSVIGWACDEYEIDSGGLAMRFGDTSKTGATVSHLHAHLIVPAKDKNPEDKVRFKIS